MRSKPFFTKGKSLEIQKQVSLIESFTNIKKNQSPVYQKSGGSYNLFVVSKRCVWQIPVNNSLG